MRVPFRLGLTGGIGSGKSTVAGYLESFGAARVDADHIARQITSPSGVAISAIRSAFGPELIDEHGALDRARMRELAFSNPEVKLQLEAIIHPLVGREISRQIQQAQHENKRLIVLDIPLLVESGRWTPGLDAVMVVDCSAQTQIVRTMERSQLPAAQVQAIIANQASPAQRRAVADIVLYNDSISLDALRKATCEVAHRFGL